MDEQRRAFASLPQASVVQGAYWLIFGAWPLVHYRSFELITGRKTDDWLARTAGALIASLGIVLLMAGVRGRSTRPEIATAGLLSGIALVSSDVVYALRGRIPKIYLLDALVHVPLFALWLRDLRTARDAARRSPAVPGDLA